MYSELVDKYIKSPFYSVRTANIDTITIHHMGCVLTIEQCGAVFQRKGRNASSNYGIDSDGRIACYVDEEHRAWTSSNKNNDNRAITIEVSNESSGGEWYVADKAIEALIKLLSDICTRYNILPLVWSENKNNRKKHLNGCNMTVHRDFSATLCPGQYLYSKQGYIANEVNKACHAETAKPKSFIVRIKANTLNVREYAGTQYEVCYKVRKGDAYTIVETVMIGNNEWGKLKSGIGWICLTKYTERV